MSRRARFLVSVLFVGIAASFAQAADWPQFMRVPEHTGDAADEVLKPPLKLATLVGLDDAVQASPAAVGGRVYVVDQMGTAYSIDPKAGAIIWKRNAPATATQPAMGGNTSSPCVAKGRVCYGTTAGVVHILDARDGKVIASTDVGSPITGSLTFANDSLYFQSVGAKVFRMDLDGKVIWEYDHYKSFKTDDERFKARGNATDLATNLPMYGGGEVAVSGKRLLVNMGWDMFCLEDAGPSARLAWCNRLPLWDCSRGSGSTWMGICAGAAVSGQWVYAGYPGCELVGDILRLKLEDGFCNAAKDPVRYVWNRGWRQHWAVFSTVAVRGETAFAQSHHEGVAAHQFGNKTLWWGYPHPQTDEFPSSTPGIAGATLTKDYCIAATVKGELYAIAIDSTGTWPDFKPAPFRFETPSKKIIASCPIIADGCVYFGSDDGHLYGLSAEGNIEAKADKGDLHKPLSKVKSPTGKVYGQTGPYGTQANTDFVDDANLRGPMRLRWAIRTGAMLRAPMCASEQDIFFLGMEGEVGAVEQETGRIRWRRRLMLTSSNLSLAITVSGLHVRDLGAGKITWSSLGFAPRACALPAVASGRVFVHPQNGMLYCFEPIGGKSGTE
ncbi:MAG: PQQ-binding-like beta-propeller repeat protein [Phycisphaerae bacterium]